jgi:hypothetical protein
MSEQGKHSSTKYMEHIHLDHAAARAPKTSHEEIKHLIAPTEETTTARTRRNFQGWAPYLAFFAFIALTIVTMTISLILGASDVSETIATAGCLGAALVALYLTLKTSGRRET